jgi:hypothetical protein
LTDGTFEFLLHAALAAKIFIHQRIKTLFAEIAALVAAGEGFL